MIAPLFAAAFALLSACGASSPSGVAIAPRPEVGEPSPATDADCSSPPPALNLGCAEGDEACARTLREGAKAWHAWTLRCEPVTPRDPIAGEIVRANVPYPPGGEGICTAGNLSVEKIEQGGVTVLRVKNDTHGRCDDILSFSGLDLGKLPAGRYRIETRYWGGTFVVRPADADPGDLPETTRLAVEVAMEHLPGQCFGMPGPELHGAPTAGFEEERIGRQLKKAFPGKSYAELQRLYAGAMYVTVTPDGANSWRYAYRDGACCSISEVDGTIVRDAAGHLTVGSPRVVRSESVPC